MSDDLSSPSEPERPRPGIGAQDEARHAADAGTVALQYQGWKFLCSAQREGPGVFKPVVSYRMQPTGEEKFLQQDSEPYGTEAEALRHAEQQAIRWVHDRSGDGQGQQ